MILLLIMYMLFAAEFPIMKWILGYTNTFFLETVRMLIGGVIFLAYYIIIERGKLKIFRIDWSLFAQLIFFYICISYIACGWALQYMSSLKANILHALMPLFSAAIAYFIFKDRPTIYKICGMCIGFLGMAMICLCSTEAWISITTSNTLISLPDVIMLISIISTAYGYFLLKTLYNRGYALSLLNGYAMLIGGVIIGISSCWLSQESWFECVHKDILFCGAFLLFLIVNVVDTLCYGILIKKYSVTFLNFSGFLTPIFGLIFEYYWGGMILPFHAVAIVLILLGLYIFAKDEFKIKESIAMS